VLALSRVEIALFAGALGLAIGISALLTPVVARWARGHGMVAAPRQDRWHRQPTPLLGGVAIYGAAMLVILGLGHVDNRLLGLLAGGTLLFVTGLIDDWRRLRPHTKLVLQILAACYLVLGGVRIETTNLAAIAIPLTILWVVGITNAFNLLDNMDGLSAGTAAIAAFFLFGFSVSVGDAGMALLCLAVAGAALGFLVYNFNPARIFMGDSGSMFLGFMLSGVALLGTREMASDVFFVLLVPVAMMGLPIFDTTLVTIVRTLEGRPLSQGGRDHLSHRLVAMGLSERQAVLLLYLLAAGFGSLGLIARSLGVWVSLTAAGVMLVVVALFGAYLAQVRIFGPAQFAEAERLDRLANRPIVHGMVMFKRELALVALDFVLICVAYLGAFVLRYGLPNPQIQPDPYATLPTVLTASLALVVVVKLVLLVVCQAYRGMWRYVGMSDLLGLGKATVASSAILVVALPFVVRNVVVIPRSVLVIDWLVFTLLLVGSRVSFAALNDTFARLQSRRMPHVLVVGAGDVGEIVLRSLIRSRPAAYRAIGFIDPDPNNRNRSMHGVRVLGTLNDLERVVLEHDVDLVVLAMPHAPRDMLLDVGQRCEALGVPTYQASTFVEMHFAGAFTPLAAQPGGGAPPSLPRR
jgi:UDP-GlcNAc:undecaprenyl-phosphate/decaprenyl-phosphate GlcNAc-1-phosphate transferase